MDFTSLIKQLDWLDDQQQAMCNLVIQLCDQNSGTLNLNGVASVRKLLEDEFAALGGDLKLVDSDNWTVTDPQGNFREQPLGQSIHIVQRPAAEFKVMLCIHMDTVYDLNHAFQSCRWLDETTLNGPGVADAKGGLVVMLFALKALENSAWAKNIGWEVILNADEEIGSPGSIGLIRQRAPHCQVGLLFEPTLPDGTLISWRKGSGNFSFVVRGKSVHAGRDFHAGRNAVTALAKLICRIDSFNIDDDVTLNVGRIEGGGALNIVPDLAIAHVNARVKTVEQKTQVEQRFRQLVEEFNSLDGFQVSYTGQFSSPPKILDEGTRKLQQRIEQCGAALGIDIRWQGSGGASDGNKFLAAGLPNIDTLGPCGGNIHSGDEFLDVSSLVPRTKLAALILLSLAADN